MRQKTQRILITIILNLLTLQLNQCSEQHESATTKQIGLAQIDDAKISLTHLLWQEDRLIKGCQLAQPLNPTQLHQQAANFYLLCKNQISLDIASQADFLNEFHSHIRIPYIDPWSMDFTAQQNQAYIQMVAQLETLNRRLLQFKIWNQNGLLSLDAQWDFSDGVRQIERYSAALNETLSYAAFDHPEAPSIEDAEMAVVRQQMMALNYAVEQVNAIINSSVGTDVLTYVNRKDILGAWLMSWFWLTPANSQLRSAIRHSLLWVDPVNSSNPLLDIQENGVLNTQLVTPFCNCYD